MIKRDSEHGYSILKGIVFSILVLWSVIVIFPLIWSIYSALKSNTELFQDIWSLPEVFQWNNFSRVWVDGRLGSYIVNSVFTTSISVILVTFVSLLASYPLARYKFTGNGFLHSFFIAGMMFPVFLGLVPLFFLLDNLKMLDSYLGFILVCISYGIPFGVFILHSFFLTIPYELEEAAIIDGCSQFSLFFKVMLPLAKPGIVTMVIFQFIRIWNEYLFALVIITDDKKYPLPLGLYQLYRNQEYVADWVALLAGLVITILPVFIIYVIFQNKLTKGLMAGAFKG